MWSMHYLKNNFTFDKALRDIVSRGGDTSNNATIVGGLLGARHGI
jgi:ADP-ribosylglycohydrolase